MDVKKVLFFVIVSFFSCVAIGQADVNQIKAYKAAFPDAKPKCVDCHVDAIPKKDEGKHNWTAYGLKVKETAAQSATAKPVNVKPTAETYKKVGKAEDYKEENTK